MRSHWEVSCEVSWLLLSKETSLLRARSRQVQGRTFSLWGTVGGGLAWEGGFRGCAQPVILPPARFRVAPLSTRPQHPLTPWDPVTAFLVHKMKPDSSPPSWLTGAPVKSTNLLGPYKSSAQEGCHQRRLLGVFLFFSGL